MTGAVVLLAIMSAAAGDVAALFREAREAERVGDFATALRKYDEALAEDPGLAEAWSNRGIILYGMERHREALRAFERAAALKPRLFAPQLFCGIEYLRSGEPRKAVLALRAALKLEPGNPQANLALAAAYAGVAQFDEAVDLYRAVIRRAPALEEARYGLAVAYLNWSKSAARRLVDSASPYGDLIMSDFLAVAGFPDAAGNHDVDALRKAEAAAAVRPSAGDPLAQALAPWRAGNYSGAARALRPKGGGLPEGRALYWFSRVCQALAREALLDAVSHNPGSFRAHLLLADLAQSSADTATARAEYEKAAVLSGDPEVTLVFLQFLAPIDAGAALEHARKAIALAPAHPGLNCALGRLLLKSGEPSEAVACFRRALAADPSLPAARAGLADAYAGAGDLRRAIEAMEPVVRADPDGSWHYRLAGWYRQTGQAEKAKEAFAATARIKSELRAREQARFLENRGQ